MINKQLWNMISSTELSQEEIDSLNINEVADIEKMLNMYFIQFENFVNVKKDLSGNYFKLMNRINQIKNLK